MCWTLATKLRLASSLKILWDPPWRSLAIWEMMDEGTTSWFLEPISAYPFGSVWEGGVMNKLNGLKQNAGAE